MNILEQIVEQYQDEDILKADGFDNAILGIDSKTMRLIYSSKKCIDILIDQEMSREEALEYFSYNVEGAYVGEKTPIWCDDLFDEYE